MPKSQVEAGVQNSGAEGRMGLARGQKPQQVDSTARTITSPTGTTNHTLPDSNHRMDTTDGNTLLDQSTGGTAVVQTGEYADTGSSQTKESKKRWKTLPTLIFLRISLVVASLLVLSIATWFFVHERAERGRFMTSTRLSIMDKEVQRACRFIEQQCTDPRLSLEEICRELVTGPAFLQTLFLRELGMSVEDFIEQVRVNRVKMMLQEKAALSPNAYAERSGFASAECMERAFRKTTGVDFRRYAENILSQKINRGA